MGTAMPLAEEKVILIFQHHFPPPSILPFQAAVETGISNHGLGVGVGTSQRCRHSQPHTAGNACLRLSLRKYKGTLQIIRPNLHKVSISYTPSFHFYKA
jgi:hypothetical protein